MSDLDKIAIDYAHEFIGSRKFAPYQNTLTDFKAGYNHCMLKTVKDLEAKNVELEKKLKEIEDKEINKRIDLMSLANTHTKAVKYIATLEKKLEIAVEALENYANARVYTGATARIALAAINGEGI